MTWGSYNWFRTRPPVLNPEQAKLPRHSGTPILTTPAATRPDLRFVFGLWALAVATLLWRSFGPQASGAFFADTDDAMRMVVVRDLLGGQNWFDLIQHRLNTPFGAEIHWSRLIDLPLAGLVMLFTPLVGEGGALIAAGTVWPLVLLFLLLWLSARLTLELVGPAGLLPALAIPVLSPAIMAEFEPGRVDHHGAIVVTTLALLWLCVAAQRRPALAWLAGIAAATAIAIAVESLPLVVAAILAFGLAYIADGTRRSALRNFGLAFAGATALHLALIRPPILWMEAACDMLSPVYVLAGLATGAAFAMVSLLPAPRGALARFVLLAALGMVAAAIVVLAYPQCLGGPYAALDPWLQQNWIAAIIEAKPWLSSLTDVPGYAVAVGVPALLGTGLTVFILARNPADHRLGWLVLLVFIALATLVMLVQVRGARLAVMPAIPAAAWLIARARTRYLARPRLMPALALVGSWLAFSGIALAVVVTLASNTLFAGGENATEAEARRAAKEACLTAAALADLAALPPERIMTPIDFGSHMLLETPHAVVSAPYHRNEQGLLDTFAFFNGPMSEARDIARQRGLALVVTCPAMSEMKGLAGRHPTALVDRLAANDLPQWLQDVSVADSPLKVYAILP